MAKRKPKSNLAFRVVGGEHVARWNPGPRLRAGGFKAFDLWAAPGDGMAIADWRALGFDRPLTDEVRRKPAEKARAKPMAAGRAILIAAMLTEEAKRILRDGRNPDREGDQRNNASPMRPKKQALDLNALFDDFLAASAKKELAVKTLVNYRVSLNAVRQWIGAETPAIVTREFLEEAISDFIRAHGAHGGRRSMQTLQTALAWAAGREKWRAVMPPRDNYSNLQLAKPPQRLRVGLEGEMETLLLAFDDPARLYAELETPAAERILTPRPSLGDGLVLMLWTCARVNDALSMTDRTIEGGRSIVYQQQKTGTVVNIPILGPLAERLPAMQRRRRAVWQARRLNHDLAELVISEQDGRPYWREKASGERYHRPYNDAWNAHRDLAARAAPSLKGEGLNRLNKPNLEFRPQDCRDTAVTRLLEAGCELAELVTWHGSSVEEIVRLTKHYMEFAPSFATAAGEKLLKMAEARGMRV